MIGLQEGRVDMPSVITGSHYHKFSGPAAGGQLGCQLWVAKCETEAHSKVSKHDARSFAVVHADARLVAVAGCHLGMRVVYISAHAPTAGASDAVAQEWWWTLRDVIRKAPRGYTPCLMVDANFRFDCSLSEGKCSRTSAVGRNAELFCAFLEDVGMQPTDVVDCFGRPVHSWISPQGRPDCIDFVCVPVEWQPSLVTLGVPQDFVDETSGYDHSPVYACVVVVPTVMVERRAVRYDVTAMCTQEGQKQLAQIWSSVPRIPWHVGIDTHLDLINAHVQQAVAKTFPAVGARVKKPCVSLDTWDLRRRRRDIRHLLGRFKQLRAKVLVHLVFKAWCQRQGVFDANKGGRSRRQYCRLSMSIARVARQIPMLTKELRVCAKKDEANYIHSMFQEAWRGRPDEKARLIRCVLRTGRRYRPPCAAPALQRLDCTVAVERSEVLRMFGKHFACAEHATPARLADLAAQRSIPDRGNNWIDPNELPSVAEISFAFAQLKCGKVAGLSAIPPEAFQVAPRFAAEVHLPILLKAAARHHWPLLWRGGLAVAIPKVGRDPLSTSGWRSILLIEPACKALCKALRLRLTPALENSAPVGLSGARQGRPVEFPSHFAQAHLARLKRKWKTGGVVYFDGQAAVYSVMREFFFEGAETLSEEQLDRLVAAIHPSLDVQLIVRAFLTRSPVLANSGVAPAVCNILQASMTRTWFAVD